MLSGGWRRKEEKEGDRYRHGQPLMGRAWREDGRLRASFSDGEHEFTGQPLGSLQLLGQLPSLAAGFEYCWLPYEDVRPLPPSLGAGPRGASRGHLHRASFEGGALRAPSPRRQRVVG